MKKKAIYIMGTGVLVLLVICVVVWFQLYKTNSYYDQLELGEKYLNELDYENAELCFLNAIEIDKKKVAPYVQLSNVYVAQGDYDSASEIIEQAKVIDEKYNDSVYEDKLAEQLAYIDSVMKNAQTVRAEENVDEEDEVGESAEGVTADKAESNAGDLEGDTQKADENIQNADEDKIVDNQEDESAGSDLFVQMPRNFAFSSGVGGWGTTLTLNSDGTFTGEYHDSEMGATGSGYSGGSCYICNFNGKFTMPEKVNDYTYSMKLEYLNKEGTVGEEYIENDIKYIYAEPYGLDNADKFLIYLPGAPTAALPEQFVGWVGSYNIDASGGLKNYGIYNLGGQEGFYGYDG